MERHRSWDGVLLSIYQVDAHDLKLEMRMRESNNQKKKKKKKKKSNTTKQNKKQNKTKKKPLCVRVRIQL